MIEQITYKDILKVNFLVKSINVKTFYLSHSDFNEWCEYASLNGYQLMHILIHLFADIARQADGYILTKK